MPSNTNIRPPLPPPLLSLPNPKVSRPEKPSKISNSPVDLAFSGQAASRPDHGVKRSSNFVIIINDTSGHGDEEPL